MAFLISMVTGAVNHKTMVSLLTKILDQYGKQDSWSEFQDQFSGTLSDMTPQNRRAFKNLMVLCHELVYASRVFILCLLTLRFTV